MQRGMALVSALLLLLVMTMLGVGMFRSFGIQERIAGNTRERQRALHAATAAQSYAEWWLTANKGANAQVGTDCQSMAVIVISATTPPQTCIQALSNPIGLPWSARIEYTPSVNATAMTTGSSNVGTADAYYAPPAFYINWASGFYDKTSGTATNNYLIDAYGYAGTTLAASVVESSFSVNVTYTAQNTNTKFVNLGGQ
jgi:type IV pilus assembly protein PilX